VTAGLSARYLEHLTAPRNLGDLVPADLAGEAGSVVGGMGVRVTLRLAEAPPPRPIGAAMFRALASPAPRAPGSVLTQRLAGLAPERAARIEPRDLLDELGGSVPEPVARAAGLLVAALRAALSDGAAAARADAPGVLVCRCLAVGDRRVRHAIRVGARDVPSIGLDCHAGQGCHSCWPDLRAILDEETVAREAPRRDGGRDSSPATALASVVESLVRPLWRAQGVRLGSVAVEGGGGATLVARLSVAAVEPGALASPIGACAIARHALRESLAEDVRVEPA
jgi:bacterioferritin-associated ferredoxin